MSTIRCSSLIPDKNVEKRSEIINEAYKVRLRAVRNMEQERSREILRRYKNAVNERNELIAYQNEKQNIIEQKKQLLKAIEDFENRMKTPDAHTEAEAIRNKISNENYKKAKEERAIMFKKKEAERYNTALEMIMAQKIEEERHIKEEEEKKAKLQKKEVQRAKSAAKKSSDLAERRAKFFIEQHKRDFPEMYNDDGTIRKNRRFLEVTAETGMCTPVHGLSKDIIKSKQNLIIRNPSKSEYFHQDYSAGCYSKFNDKAATDLQNENELNIENGAFVMANRVQADAIINSENKKNEQIERDQYLKRVILKNSLEMKKNDTLADEGLEILARIQKMRLQ